MMLTINGPIYKKGLRSPTQKFIAHSITPTALISSLFLSSNKDVKSQRIHEPRLFYYYYYYIPLIMSFGHFHMGLRWIDLWVTACLGLWSLVSLTAPNVHSYAVDAIISSQVLPLPSASVIRCSPKPIQYANMYFHYWLHWMNDRIIVIDDVHSTFCGLEKRSHYIPNLMFITQNQYKPLPPPPKAIYWITFVLIYCNLFISRHYCTHKRRQIDLLGIVANNNNNCGHASLILQSQYHGCYDAKRYLK